MTAYCYSAPEWEAVLAERLWKELLVFSASQERASLGRWPYDPAIEVLQHAGYSAELDRWFGLMSMSETQRERLDKRRGRITSETPKHIAC